MLGRLKRINHINIFFHYLVNLRAVFGRASIWCLNGRQAKKVLMTKMMMIILMNLKTNLKNNLTMMMTLTMKFTNN